MNTYDDVAYIIGNGTSRLEFDLDTLREKGTSFGCNALYREWIPDFLVAIDDKITEEINHAIENGILTRQQFIAPPWTECYEPAEYNPRQPRSNAGMNAMIEAIRRDKTQLICFGFDFMAKDPSQCTSNVFEGTNAYGPETHASREDSINRIKYMNWFAHQHEDVTFVFVFPDNFELNKKYVTASNISTITYDLFTQAILED